MKKIVLTTLLSASLTVSAAVTGGAPLIVAAGTTETVGAGATVEIPYFYNSGTLTVGAGATLNVQGALNTSFGALGEGSTCTLNLEENANLTITSVSNAFSQTAFAAAYLGATGIVNIASGATMSVPNHCRFACNDDSPAYRLKRTFVELNISGTLRTLETAAAVELTPFFFTAATAPELAGSTNNYPLSFVANLNPGGLWSVMSYRGNDCAISRFNFNGGVLQFCKYVTLAADGGSAIVEYHATAGNSIIIDTQGYTVDYKNVQAHQFRGAGGLVKRGSGTLRLYAETKYSDFSGPIRVEAGTLMLGRPLLPEQTVYVARGAQFIPCSSADYAFVTYSNPADAPAAGSLFSVNGNIPDGIDLIGLAPAFATDRLGGPLFDVAASVAGTVTHAAADLDHPFTLVGQNANGKLTLSNTGLDSIPLAVQGPGTFEFAGDSTFTAGDGMITLANSGVYRRSGVLTILDPNAVNYTLQDGGLGGSDVYLGVNGADIDFTVAPNGTLSATSRVLLGSNDAEGMRERKGTTHLDVQGNVDANEIRFGAYGSTNGTTEVDSRGVLTVEAGGSVKGGVVVNDTFHGRFVFDGGTHVTTMGYGTSGAIYNVSQAASQLDIEVTSADGTLNYGNFTNALAGGGGKPVSITGDGTLNFVGSTYGILNWGPAGMVAADWRGDTVFSGGTVKLGGAPFPSGAGKGVVRVTSGTFDLYGGAMTVNDFVLEGGKLTNSAAKAAAVTVGADGRDIVNTIDYPSNTVLTKAGAGTMTTNRKLPEQFVLAGGTFAIQSSTYAHYRFKVEQAYGVNCNSMQIGEFKLLCDGVDVTRPYQSVGRSSQGAASPGGEQPVKAVDGLLNTKFLDFNAAKTGTNAAYNDYCWLQLDYATPVTVTHYSWATGNDNWNPNSTDGLCRNPKNWRFQGSADGTTWVDLDVQADIVTNVGSNNWCGVDFPADRGGYALKDSSVVVAAGATIDIGNGAAAIGSLITQGSGTVNLHDATLRLDGSGIAAGGGITGTGSIEKTGSGTFSISGANDFVGDVTVGAGTLKLGTSAKWFRLTIKQTGPADKVMQCSEFGLFDVDGIRLNLGLTMAANGTPASELQPGTFAKAAAYACGGSDAKGWEDAYNLFDGKTDTKWCAIGNDMSSSLNDSTKWRILTMRLADDAAPAVSCNFCTANDSPNRSPRNWSVEASYDGENWFTVGDYGVTPTTNYFTWYNDEKPYAFTTAASWDASPFPADTPIEVRAGATLDCGGHANMVDALRYDASTGGGMITNFAPVANGTLYLVNATDDTTRLPLSLTIAGAVVNPENLKTWSVVVDGKPCGGKVRVDPDTGKLFIQPAGVVIYVR